MLSSLTQILLFQLAGELITRGLGWSLSGPVVGLVLFLGFLVLNQGPGPELQRTGQGLLQHLSLLFIPAGASILLHLHTLEKEWFALTATLLLSTGLTMVVTAFTMKVLSSRTPAPQETREE